MTMLVVDQSPVPSIAPVAQTPQTAPAAVPAQSVEALQTQLASLSGQLAGQRAQWKGLQEQINSMLKSNPVRPAVVAKWTDVGVQIAQTEGDIARVQAQLSQVQGTPIAGVPVPPPFRGRGFDPDMITEMSFVLILAVIVPTSIAYARRVWRGKPAPQRDTRDEAGARRMERMEHAIDAIAIEIERVSEGQRFVTKVLAERPAALGAGPIEAIRAAEREPAVPVSSRT